MNLRKLELQNFRLFSFIAFEFTDGINLITGKNGQGKTSILESIHYLALTKSFRTSIDKNAVKYDNTFLNIRGNIISAHSQQENIRFIYSFQNAKQIYIDDKRISKFSDYIGTIPCVVLTLNDLKLSFGSPNERRRFIDILLSQVSPVYLENLKNYRKSVQQRNALLSHKNKEEIINQIDIWNNQLVKYGIPLVQKRIEFIKYLNDNLTEQYQQYSSSKDEISVRYKSTITSRVEDETVENLTEEFNKNLHKRIDYEIGKAFTTTGPHRDDMEFFLNNKIFKEFGSQGENKTLIIVLKFLEWEYLSNNKNKKPVLLLDDVFGELDESRMNGLLFYLKKIGQAFITTTTDSKFSDNIISSRYLINDGQVFNA